MQHVSHVCHARVQFQSTCVHACGLIVFVCELYALCPCMVIYTCVYYYKMVAYINKRTCAQSTIWAQKNDKCQCWDPISAAVSVLNIYIFDDINGSNTHTLCAVYDHDSVVARHNRTKYTHAIASMLYSTWYDEYIHWLHATHEHLTKFLEQLY